MTAILSGAEKAWLVERATKIIDKVGHMRNQASQLRNMMQVAGEESEISVLINYLNYQAARQATRRFWEKIHGDVRQTLEEANQRFGEDTRQAAVQHLFGYMVRHYTYLTELVNRQSYGGGHKYQGQSKRKGGQR